MNFYLCIKRTQDETTKERKKEKKRKRKTKRTQILYLHTTIIPDFCVWEDQVLRQVLTEHFYLN